MMRLSGFLCGAALMAIAAAGCGGAKGDLIELQRAAAGDLEVVLLSSHDSLRHGSDAFVIEFRSKGGSGLVDVGAVKASATMPMPGMPMFARIDVQRSDVPGRYAASGQFDMAGTWRLTVEWMGAAGAGSVSFSGSVQ